MDVSYFVGKESIVRRIWGRSDTVLFIFAGASAEFALNKAVDWLYFTGKLPSDPLGRLFSTVAYARTIVFSEEQVAIRTIHNMAAIHSGVEKARGVKIPDWAYRDVLFMLIDYSIRAFEALDRPMVQFEKREVFNVFNKVGILMGLAGLPASFEEWLAMREDHLCGDLQRSDYTDDLFGKYRKHLGWLRFQILKEAQILVVPGHVQRLMEFRTHSMLHPLVWLYKLARRVNADAWMRRLIVPSKYQDQIKALDTT